LGTRWQGAELEEAVAVMNGGPDIYGAHALGKKTALFEPFIYKNQHFTKTGSGQT
jgi:hypothetical protein